jgi:hypothetical protein
VTKGWNNAGSPAHNELITLDDLSKDTLQDNLADGPLYARYASSTVAHILVVTGAVSAEGHISLVTTNNPWGDKNIQTFDEFINGFPRGKGYILSSVMKPDI